MVNVQPMVYEKITAFKERMQIVSKLNEVIDFLNTFETTINNEFSDLETDINDRVDDKLDSVDSILNGKQERKQRISTSILSSSIIQFASNNIHPKDFIVGIIRLTDNEEGQDNDLPFSFVVPDNTANKGHFIFHIPKNDLENAYFTLNIVVTPGLLQIKSTGTLDITINSVEMYNYLDNYQ